jgi:hypothetical protein
MAIPFVPPMELTGAVDRIRALFKKTDALRPWEVTFSTTEIFQHKDSVTVYLKPDALSEERLIRIREKLETIFKFPLTGDGEFRPHLTIGQASSDEAALSLKEKAEMLLPISWQFNSFAIISKNELDSGRMEVVACITDDDTISSPPPSSPTTTPRCYIYDESPQAYRPYQPTPSLFNITTPRDKITISTYNILHSPLQRQTQSSPRLPILLNTILTHSATLLILQEVTDTAWSYFLSDKRLRRKYPYVSAPENLPLPNIRNITLLSSIPFKAHYLPLVTAHKPALIIDIEGLTVAGVHLHAGLHEEKLALKLKELSKLITYLDSTRNPVIIAGDFNIPSIPREYTAALPKTQELLTRYTDTWMEKPTGCGNTFTPNTNRFAREGATVLYPQRHDRIYFSKKAGILVERTELFGIPLNEEDLGSDHWGLSVDLRINLDEKLDHDSTTEIISVDVPETNWTDEEMRQTLTDANQVPDDHHNQKVMDALNLLRSILDPIKQLLPFELQVVGSFALGVHTKSSDTDVMAVSTISQKVFWEIFLQHLQRYKLSDQENHVKVLRIIRNAKTPMVELLIDNYKIEIQYCPAGRLLPLYLLPFKLLISDGIRFLHYLLRQICYIFLHLR